MTSSADGSKIALPLTYRIFEHPELSGKLCLDKCYKYFECSGVKAPSYCVCALRGAQRTERRKRVSEDLAAFDAMSGGSSNKKPKVVCPYYESGNCSMTRP